MIRELLWRRSAKTSVQLFRSLVAGGIAFVADVAILFLLTEQFGVHYLLSAAFGFVAGIVITYLISIWWVFHTRRMQRALLEFGLFALFGATGLLLNEAIMWGLVEFAAVHYLAAKIVATVVVFFFNFFSRKRVLFS